MGSNTISRPGSTTVDELQNWREQVEKELAAAAYTALNRFQENTGVQVTAIHVNLRDVRTVGDVRGRSILEGVRVEIDV